MSPPEIIQQDFSIRVADQPAVERRQDCQLLTVDFREIDAVGRSEERSDACGDFVDPALEEVGVELEDEGELVGLAVGEKDVVEVGHYVPGRLGHYVEGEWVVWLFEV